MNTDWQAWAENKQQWYPEQAEAWRGIACLLEWIGLRLTHARTPCAVDKALAAIPWDQLRADIDHSSLLRRLLEGKRPLPEPPPRAYSYPWYALIENGRAELNADEVAPVPPEWKVGDRLTICQSPDWEILKGDPFGEDTRLFALRHVPDGSRWWLTLNIEDKWILQWIPDP